MATQRNQCAALALLALVAPVGSLYAKGDLLGDQVLEEGIAPWQEIGDTVWPNTVAICAIMRDENPEDVRQWLRYHKWLGVDRIMLTDNGSKVDPQPMVQDWIDSGFVEWSSEEEPSSQMKTYQRCLDDHRLTFSWIAFIDLDEMLVVRDPEVGTLKELLREYRFFPGLSVHWVMFGSNGHQARPQGGGMLQHYTTCENTAFGAVKTIVNTYHVQHVLRQPHNFRYKAMGTSVNELRYPLEIYCHVPRQYKVVGECLESMWNAWTGFSIGEDHKRSVDRVALYHYATRSREDFDIKSARGGGTTRTPKGLTYWHALQESASHSSEMCAAGLDLFQKCCAAHVEEDRAMLAKGAA